MASVTAEEKEKLDSVYLDPASAASFTSPDKLFRAVKDTFPDITRKKIESYLLENSGYYLHRPVYRHFNRNKVMVATLNEILGLDLMDVSEIREENDGFRYVLLGVDLFSRKAYATPMKSKSCVQDTIEALQTMLGPDIQYRSFYTDKGGEFICKELKKFLDTKGAKIYFATNYVKVNIVERFIRTLRLKMERYFESQQTRRYIDVLQQLIDSYNKTYHRSIGTSPASVNQHNSAEIYQYQYLPFKPQKKKKKKRYFKYKLGDIVRVSDIQRTPFSKETRRERWTEEVFKIVQRKMRENIPVYKVEDMMGGAVIGTWYEQELTPASYSEDAYFKLDPAHKPRKRKRQGKTEYYVKYQGWPKKFNRWIKKNEQ